jgi:hypothetical protein
MIPSRSCTKSSAYFGGGTRYWCTAHNHEMDHQSYTCALGVLESGIIAQANIILMQHEKRIAEIEEHFNAKLKTFAANLEKLHEPDPGTPT